VGGSPCGPGRGGGEALHAFGDQVGRPVGEVQPQEVALGRAREERRSGHEGNPLAQGLGQEARGVRAIGEPYPDEEPSFRARPGRAGGELAPERVEHGVAALAVQRADAGDVRVVVERFEQPCRRALREGISDHGAYYFPVFPYTSFTGMSDQDIADLFAYLQTQEPVKQQGKRHDVRPPFSWRFLQIGWRALFFRPGPLLPVPGKDAAWNRGNYLANAVVHCGECHTPRNLLGGLEQGKAYSGNPQGPDNLKVPNITPDPASGIGKWSVAEITDLLKTGQTPGFDFVGSAMGEVVKGTSKLTDADREAIAIYVKSLPPISTPKPAKKE